MTPADISKITSGVAEALNSHVEDLVRREAARIPHLIREEVETVVQSEIRRAVREKLEGHISVVISCS